MGAILALAIPCSLSGTLLITEIQSNQSGTAPSGANDYWELTNFGTAAVDLDGWRWNDDEASPTGPKAHLISGLVIEPGESVLFFVGSSEIAFREWWSLPSSVKVYRGGPSLGQNDCVYLFNAAGVSVTSLCYSAGGFTREDGTPASGGHAGISAGGQTNSQAMVWVPASGTGTPRYTAATIDRFGARRSAFGTDVGSPGISGANPTPALPYFTSPQEVFGRETFNIALSQFLVSAVSPTGLVALTLAEGPAWLSLQDQGNGTATLQGVIPQDGPGWYTVAVTATSGAQSVTKDLTVWALKHMPRVILNEYNAVADDSFINARSDEEGNPVDGNGNPTTPGSDTHFNSVLGNGGPWFELVVLGNGTAGSRLDMRGWTIELSERRGTPVTLTLSDNAFWAEVMAGTILTFTERDSAAGGLDTSLNRVNLRSTVGYAWSNIWAADPVLINQGASTAGRRLPISADDTRILIRTASGSIEFGPGGEDVVRNFADGTPQPIGLNSREIFKLEQLDLLSPYRPDPYFGSYRDGSSSTFGAPNTWSSGSVVQSFAPFRLNDLTPVFSSQPEVVSVDGTYRYDMAAAPVSGGVRFTALELPEWLTLTDNGNGTARLANNRPITLDEAGYYRIQVRAASMVNPAHAAVQDYLLTVFNPSPTVILNEYNAVLPTNFLGGEDPAARDTFFGRVAGNGGTWFELVVVGDGGFSVVDLRGWTIEVSNRAPHPFVARQRLKLSHDFDWNYVPAGTILTFIDRTTDRGGFDTSIRFTNLWDTEGWQWTNVWMGDSRLLDYTSPTLNGYTIGDGVVQGVGIDHENTQFRLLDAEGRVVFGPVGEGIAPLSGISSTEVFELEGHPSPSVRPTVAADNASAVPGYDDGVNESTF